MKRLRGKGLMQVRAKKRKENPFCVDCLARGIEKAWDELDHIIPLEEGGSNEWTNLVGRCTDCHRLKTAMDRGHVYHGEQAAHPWEFVRVGADLSKRVERDLNSAPALKRRLDET